MRHILTIIFGLLVTNSVFATGQVPDYLIYQGDTIAIFSNPLEQYFERTGKRELIDFVGCGSTACWRGYKAIWELKIDSLFLRQITSCHKDCGLEVKNADLKKMFGTDNVFADWFTGKLIIPQGKQVQYIHMGYASIYERELHISFKNGLKTKEKTISNKKIADKIELQNQQRNIAKRVQDTLFYQVQQKVDWDTTKTAWYNLCDEKYILTYNKKGKLKKVWVDWEGETFREKIDDWWWNMTDDRKCRRTIKKALKPFKISYLDLPKHKIEIQFEIIYDRKIRAMERILDGRRITTANTGFASGGETCKLGALCFYSSSVQVDSFVLQNPPSAIPKPLAVRLKKTNYASISTRIQLNN